MNQGYGMSEESLKAVYESHANENIARMDVPTKQLESHTSRQLSRLQKVAECLSMEIDVLEKRLVAVTTPRVEAAGANGPSSEAAGCQLASTISGIGSRIEANTARLRRLRESIDL